MSKYSKAQIEKVARIRKAYRKVKVLNRSVYHRIVEVEIDVPKSVSNEELMDYINENSDLYVDKMDRKIKETPLEFGLGLGDGFEDTFEESEWRYESGNYGGHL